MECASATSKSNARSRRNRASFLIFLFGASLGLFVGLYLGIVGTSSGTIEDPGPLLRNEIVLMPGMTIEGCNGIGTIRILADSAYERTFEWNSFQRSVEMWPRAKRWYGSLGLYYPGPGRHWQDADGIRRAVVNEGRHYFDGEEDAIAWLKEQNSSYNGYNNTTNVQYVVYTNDGLAVCWGKTLEREQLNVDIWLVIVRGQRPHNLPGSNDAAISVTYRMLDAVGSENTDTEKWRKNAVNR